MKGLAVCVFLSCCLYSSWASSAGRQFQLMFMENLVEAPQDGPLEVYVSNTGVLQASVTVSTPGNNQCDVPSQTQNVPANSIRKFTVCWQMRQAVADYWPTQKTVLIESSQDVMVYGVNEELYSADGFYAIPVAELSTSYYVATYDPANLATQFGISAVTDNTDIQIHLPSPDLPIEVNYRGVRYTNGESFTMRMNRYDTYLAQCRGDLSGTRILSTNSIAVFSGNVRNKDSSGSRDHLTAQLTGTGDWGINFALAPVPRSQNFGDIVRVMGRRADTTVRVTYQDGTVSGQTLSGAGDFYEFLLTQSAVVSSDNSAKPLQVIQMVRSQNGPRISDVADPAMFLAVSQEKWLDDYISPPLTYTRDGNSYQVNYALIAVNSNDRNSIRVNGNFPTITWTTVNGISAGWVTVGGSEQRFTSVDGTNFGVMVYGASDRESYAFALGASLDNTGAVASADITINIHSPVFGESLSSQSSVGSRSNNNGNIVTIPNPDDPTGPPIVVEMNCVETLSIRGDGVDNDCDGLTDEEPCNKVDDDGDGLIDEDCPATSTEAFGNSYNFVFMENDVTDNPSAMSFLEVYLSAVDSQATVTYDLQNEDGTFGGVINPGDVDIFSNLDVDLRHTGNGIDTKAISVKATGDIVVYGINKQTFSTDGFLAFPDDVVGREYYTVHHYPGTDKNEFAMTPVVETETTTITVTLPNNPEGSNAVFNGVTYSGGQTFSFNLNYRQSAQVQAATATDNLNGALVRSTFPISVFSGNVRARVDPTTSSSRDHLVQQLAPVSTWGTEFVTVPIPRLQDRGDLIYLTGSIDGTVVTVRIKNSDGSNANTETYNLNAGTYMNMNVGSTQFAHIEANAPIQVYQFAKTTADRNADEADPAMMLVPPVEQWSRNYKFATVRTGQQDSNGNFIPFNNFVLVVILSNNINGLRLDGNTIASNAWTVISGSGYSAATIEVPFDTRSHELTHIDSGAYYQALMYGRGDRESFALPLGMRLVARGCVQTPQTTGDNIDNDCDGSVDEELCNSVDDDADGAIDEDCGDGSTSGTSFYVTYMDNVVEYPKDFDLELYVAVVGNNPATVGVRAPAVSFPSYDTVTEIQPGKVRGFGFTWRMRNVGQGVSQNTVYVSTNEEVVVYGVNKELYSNDAFLVYPENSLGTTYYTCSWSPSTLQTEFAVVATADNTRVDITLPSNRANIAVEYNGQTYGIGSTFTVFLNRFEVYQAQSAGDLSGTFISTSQRAAVFSGNVRTKIQYSNSRDHLVEQMLPLTSYGTTFYVVPYPDRTVGDYLKIVARFANTRVFVNGNEIGTITIAGGFLVYEATSFSSYTVTSNNAVMVVQFVKSQDGRDNPELADPAMTIVPAENNHVSSATFITPIYSGGRTPGMDYTNYMSVVIQNGQQGNLRLNGQALSGQNWDSVGNSGYVSTTFDVPSGQSHTLKTTSGALFTGRLYGRADRESYAFPIGFRFQ